MQITKFEKIQNRNYKLQTTNKHTSKYMQGQASEYTNKHKQASTEQVTNYKLQTTINLK